MKRWGFLIVIFLFLTGCGKEIITEEYLLEGEWEATAGYKDGEVTGDPSCELIEALNFKDNKLVYVDSFEKDFEYSISDETEGRIELYNEPYNMVMVFDTIIIEENGLVIEGVYGARDQDCYLERKE